MSRMPFYTFHVCIHAAHTSWYAINTIASQSRWRFTFVQPFCAPSALSITIHACVTSYGVLNILFRRPPMLFLFFSHKAPIHFQSQTPTNPSWYLRYSFHTNKCLYFFNKTWGRIWLIRVECEGEVGASRLLPSRLCNDLWFHLKLRVFLNTCSLLRSQRHLKCWLREWKTRYTL